MNINNRLNKLENKINPQSENCFCSGGFEQIEVWIKSADKEPFLSGKLVPKICGKCNKPIEKQVIIVEGVKSQIPKPKSLFQ